MAEKLGHEARTAEVVVGEWRRSILTWGFWWRTIVTVGLYFLLLWDRNKIILTSRRITQRRGNVIGGNTTTMSLEKITDISLDTPAMGAIFNWGNITVQTAGSAEAEIAFEGLGNAKQLREMIFDLKDGKLDET